VLVPVADESKDPSPTIGLCELTQPQYITVTDGRTDRRLATAMPRGNKMLRLSLLIFSANY